MALNEHVEMSDELHAALKDANDRIDQIFSLLHAAQTERQRLLNDAVAPLAEFKVGDEVIGHGQRYRITSITGEEFGLTGHRAKVWLRYHGQRVKVDGSLTGREKRIYDLKPAEAKP